MATVEKDAAAQLAQLQQELHSLHKAITVLNQMAAELDIHTAMASVRQVALELLDCERVTLFLIFERRKELRAIIEQTDILRITFGEGIAGLVAQTGGSLNLADAYSHPMFNKEVDRLTGFRTRTMLCTAVADMTGKNVAVLQALNKRSQQPFSDIDERNLKLFGTHLGNTLVKAKLHEIAKREKERLTSIYTCFKALSTSDEVAQMVVLATSALEREIIHAERAFFFLVDGPRGELWLHTHQAEPVRVKMGAEGGVVGVCAETRKAQSWANFAGASADPALRRLASRVAGGRVKSVLVQPITMGSSHERVLAVVLAINKREAEGTRDIFFEPIFTDADCDAMSLFAYEVGDLLSERSLELSLLSALSVVGHDGVHANVAGDASVGVGSEGPDSPLARNSTGLGADSKDEDMIRTQLIQMYLPEYKKEGTVSHSAFRTSFTATNATATSMRATFERKRSMHYTNSTCSTDGSLTAARRGSPRNRETVSATGRLGMVLAAAAARSSAWAAHVARQQSLRHTQDDTGSGASTDGTGTPGGGSCGPAFGTRSQPIYEHGSEHGDLPDIGVLRCASSSQAEHPMQAAGARAMYASHRSSSQRTAPGPPEQWPVPNIRPVSLGLTPGMLGGGGLGQLGMRAHGRASEPAHRLPLGLEEEASGSDRSDEEGLGAAAPLLEEDEEAALTEDEREAMRVSGSVPAHEALAGLGREAEPGEGEGAGAQPGAGPGPGSGGDGPLAESRGDDPRARRSNSGKGPGGDSGYQRDLLNNRSKRRMGSTEEGSEGGEGGQAHGESQHFRPMQQQTLPPHEEDPGEELRQTAEASLHCLVADPEALRTHLSCTNLTELGSPRAPCFYSEAQVNSWDWDFSEAGTEELIKLSYDVFIVSGVVEEFEIKPKHLRNFLTAVASHYHAIPYHNFNHVCHVLHATYLISCTTSASEVLKPLEVLALLVAALCHDLDHDGHSNSFHVNSGTELARIYNDQSVMENHHCAMTFAILSRAECNILAVLAPEQQRALRKVVIASILCTDMANHFALTQDFQKRSPVYDPEIEADRMMLIKVILHAADIGNAVRPFQVNHAMSRRVHREFEAQAAEEVQLGLPITFSVDTSDHVMCARVELNFLDYVVTTLWERLVDVLPELEPRLQQLKVNRARYRKIADTGKTADQVLAEELIEAPLEGAAPAAQAGQQAEDGGQVDPAQTVDDAAASPAAPA